MLRANTQTGSVSVEKNILTLQKGCNINTVKTAIILTYSLWDISSIYTCIMCFNIFYICLKCFLYNIWIIYLEHYLYFIILYTY